MDLKALREALKAGSITLAQFKEQAKAWLAAQLASGAMTQEDHDKEVAAVESETDPAGGGGSMTPEEVAAMLEKERQSAADKVRTEMSNKLKAAEAELEKIRREKMTEEERLKDDMAKAQQALEDQKAELNRQRVELHTITSLAKAGIDDRFKGFLAGATIEETDERIKDFQSVWAVALKEAVEKKFKDNGGDPNRNNGGGAGGQVNPWKPETLNLTKQAEIQRTNPELAKTLKAAAGVK